MDHPFVQGKEMEEADIDEGESEIILGINKEIQIFEESKKDILRALNYLLKEEWENLDIKFETRSTLDPYIPLTSERSKQGQTSILYLCKDSKTNEKVIRKAFKQFRVTSLNNYRQMISAIEVMKSIENSAFSLNLYDYFIYEGELNLILTSSSS